MHTGPSASPENSYLLFQEKDSRFSRRHVRVVTHSPNIDIAVLRQISNIYCIALSWARVESGVGSDDLLRAYVESEEFKADQRLSQHFNQLVSKMPNAAVPKISERKKPHHPFALKRSKSAGVPAGTRKGVITSILQSVLPYEEERKTKQNADYVIEEYVSSPLTSKRRDMSRYPYTARPNSDR